MYAHTYALIPWCGMRDSQTSRPPRAIDVAAAAGVSTATVSRAFNAPEKVLPEVRDKIFAVAAELGWLPNAAGAALASRRTWLAGVLIPTLDHDVFAAQVNALQAHLSASGITVLIGCSNYDLDEATEQVRVMLARGIEALAIVGEQQRPELFEMISARGVPYVVMYSHPPKSVHPCVGFDNQAAFFKLTRYLLDLGHRTFAVIHQPSLDNDRVLARLAGIREALAGEGLALRPQHIFEGQATFEFGRESLKTCLAGPGPRPTAVICGNDTLAIGALIEARAMGIDVPGTLSVTGFDDLPIAEFTAPPLTTMRVDNAAIGKAAAGYLLTQLKRQAATPQPPFEAQLIVRGSTGPVGA
ncbi:MAG: cytR1 [Proteobacteria bacterium]|nr:cytR1 [Pseudomonadota bacterium]